MKLTFDEFKTSIMPGLRAQHASADKLKAAIGEFLKGNEIADAEGNPIALETLVLEVPGTKAPAAISQPDIDKAVQDAIQRLAPKPNPDNGGSDTTKAPVIPATVKRCGRLRAFKGPDADVNAYKFGQFCVATMDSNSPQVQKSREFCQEHGLMAKAQSETVNTAGGFVVPPEFETTLIDLKEQYGTFRRNARIVPMASDVKIIPRRTGGLIAYFTAENAAITESDKTWDNVQLTAKKIATLTRYSSELNEDAMINIGDDLAEEIALAFSTLEDTCGFAGTGLAATGGIIGVPMALTNLTAGTTAALLGNVAGLRIQATTGAWTNLVMADFGSCCGRLPQYAYQPGKVKWYCHPNFWGGIMQPLALGVGGVSAAEVQDGVLQQKFLGFPVELTQSLPGVDGVATTTNFVSALFGNLELAAKFGDRRITSIAMSTDRYFDTDQIAIRGTERFDINVHDVGNASATAALRVPGPIVGLYHVSA